MKIAQKTSMNDMLDMAQDFIIQDAIFHASTNIGGHGKIACSISGGADSDIMLDLLWRLDKQSKIDYVWFDTGLEYDATKRHIKEIEEKYGIQIKRIKAKKPIPITCKEFGQPFLSKRISNYMSRLQRHGFCWEDESYDVLAAKYKGCSCALMWWCNEWGDGSLFNIKRNKWLKEFIVNNPPHFSISDKCCYYAKEQVGKDFAKVGDYDMNCVGVRKAEGGARSSAYKSCFTPKENGTADNYRPLFWFTNESKEMYENIFDIEHSDCYSVWGLERTGCAACPFGRNFEYELECIKQYEPKFYIAVNNIFGDSYEYTRKYREFCKKMDEYRQYDKDQMKLF